LIDDEKTSILNKKIHEINRLTGNWKRRSKWNRHAAMIGWSDQNVCTHEKINVEIYSYEKEGMCTNTYKCTERVPGEENWDRGEWWGRRR